jgi:hypothetical protein
MVSPGDWLENSVFSSVYQFNWNCEVRYVCQIMQGGRCYCFPQLTAVLCFSCSCLVSSSPSEVRQFGFECCPLAQKISSIIHYLPCFGEWLIAGLLSVFPVFIYWAFSTEFSSLPHSLSLLQVQHVPPPPAVCVWLQFTVCFSVCGAVQFWMLLSGSGDHLCDPLPALLLRVAYCLPTLSLCCCSCVYLLIVCCWVYILASPPFSGAGSACHLPSPLSVLNYSSLIFSFLGEVISLPRGCASLCSWGWIGESNMVCGAHLFVLSIEMQAGLEPPAVGRNGANFSLQSGVGRLFTG